MSWAAHELESIWLHKHMKVAWRVSYMAILAGALLPDLTKLPAYGVKLGNLELVKAAQPWLYHRGWPGVGPTHSLLFGVLVAMIVFVLTRSGPWAAGLLIGVWSHALTDIGDTAGTMLFFPFTTQHYSIGMWRYAAQIGHNGDAAGYYSGLGLVWDVAWLLVVVVLARHALSNRYFHENVETTDPLWPWLQRRIGAPDHLRRVVFRAYLLYGACRIFGWFLWARMINPLRGVQVIDLHWGGPNWVPAAPPFTGATTWHGLIATTAFGIAGVAACTWLAWRFARWWAVRGQTVVAQT